MPEKHALELEALISHAQEAKNILDRWYTSKGNEFALTMKCRSLINDCNDADRALVTYVMKNAPWIVEAVRQAPERVDR